MHGSYMQADHLAPCLPVLDSLVYLKVEQGRSVSNYVARDGL